MSPELKKKMQVSKKKANFIIKDLRKNFHPEQVAEADETDEDDPDGHNSKRNSLDVRRVAIGTTHC